MVPAQGWVWTQLRNVPVKDENGVVHDSDKLTAEVRRNAVMARATPLHASSLATPPHRDYGRRLSDGPHADRRRGRIPGS
jgi:hypothetical protein